MHKRVRVGDCLAEERLMGVEQQYQTLVPGLLAHRVVQVGSEQPWHLKDQVRFRCQRQDLLGIGRRQAPLHPATGEDIIKPLIQRVEHVLAHPQQLQRQERISYTESDPELAGREQLRQSPAQVKPHLVQVGDSREIKPRCRDVMPGQLLLEHE